MAPEGAFWNMHNRSHLETYLIKWEIFLKNGK